MRLSARECAAIFGCGLVVLTCSCEMHHVGEMPEVQREGPHPVVTTEQTEAGARERSTTAAPKPTLTPADFFRPTKP